MNTDVAVLFARRDSVYKSLAGCDVWDIDRDAMTWTGGAPVVAHPPCRAWGRLRTFAKPREFARSTGPFAIDQVRAWGGGGRAPVTQFSVALLRVAGPRPRRSIRRLDAADQPKLVRSSGRPICA